MKLSVALVATLVGAIFYSHAASVCQIRCSLVLVVLMPVPQPTLFPACWCLTNPPQTSRSF